MTNQPRSDQQRWGRKGGLTYAARNDVEAAMERARSVLLDSFESGHTCKVCVPGQVIPEGLSEPERLRRAAKLRTLHFTNLANKRHHG